MKRVSIQVAAPQAYEVHIGAGLLAEVEGATRAYSRRLVLSDANVAALYPPAAHALAADAAFVVAAGEASKSFATLERVLDAAAEAGLDRQSCLVCLGGGVIGDLGGLAASLYMRGIAHVQVPTTLLAQVDASVGGKTAVNLRAGKNLAGTFHSPALVLADTRTLATLSDDEYRSGLGEVVKTALIDGERALTQLESDAPALLRRDPELLAEVVARCVRTKAAIVERDPRESGERKQLNLGHTFAHAIEHAAGYGTIEHGLAVAVGLMLALRASQALGLLSDAALVDRMRRVLRSLTLPTELAELRHAHDVALPLASLLEGMRSDKKGRAGHPRLVLPTAVGRVRIDVEIEPALLVAVLEAH